MIRSRSFLYLAPAVPVLVPVPFQLVLVPKVGAGLSKHISVSYCVAPLTSLILTRSVGGSVIVPEVISN